MESGTQGAQHTDVRMTQELTCTCRNTAGTSANCCMQRLHCIASFALFLYSPLPLDVKVEAGSRFALSQMGSAPFPDRNDVRPHRRSVHASQVQPVQFVSAGRHGCRDANELDRQHRLCGQGPAHAADQPATGGELDRGQKKHENVDLAALLVSSTCGVGREGPACHQPTLVAWDQQDDSQHNLTMEWFSTRSGM